MCRALWRGMSKEQTLEEVSRVKGSLLVVAVRSR